MGGTPARAGYSSGNGVNYFELPQSGNQAALLDLENASNVGQPGLYQFSVRNGAAVVAVSVDDIALAEGNGNGAVFAVVPVRLSSSSATAVTVDYNTANGTALAGLDYVGQRGTLTFAPGVTQQNVYVEILGDSLPEGDDTFLVQISATNGVAVGDSSGTATILNDDGLTVSNITKLEGTGGGPTAFGFTVTLLTAFAQPVTVDYTTQDGTALSGIDYTATSGQLTFAAGETSKTVVVQVGADAATEADETFLLRLSNAQGAAIAHDTGTGTIVNDDGIIVQDLRILEGTSGTATTATVTLRLLSALTTPVTVDWTTQPDTATTPEDFKASSGSVTFAAGATQATVTIPIVADSLVEGNETFNVALSNALGGDIVDGLAGVTIIDDDGFQVSNMAVVEGTGGITSGIFTVTLQSALASASSVGFKTRDGTAIAGQDYTALAGTLNFAAGVVSQTVTVSITADNLPESNETFFLDLSAPSANAGISRGSAQAIVINDDGLSIGDVSVNEGNSGTGTATVSVSLNGPAAAPVTVQWATADGTATGSSDYTPASGSLTFATGETSKSISVSFNGDTLWEPNETFRVVLSNPTNSLVVDGSGTFTILNDDIRPPPSITISPSAVTEGTSSGNTLHFLVGLDYASTSDVTVAYATQDGTAKAGSDYVPASGTLKIVAGSLFGIIDVVAVADATVEPNETLTVTLSGATGGASIGKASAVGTILNDDSVLAIATEPVIAAEGHNGITAINFTVTRSGDTGVAHIVDWKIAGDGANPATAADFGGGVLPSGTITFAIGETSKTIAVPVAGDSIVEANEGFSVTLSNPGPGSALGNATATGSIVNDDNNLSISPAELTKTEGQALVFTVTRVGALTAGTTANWSVSGAGAAPANVADFTGNVLPAGTIVFAAGETSKTITIDVVADTSIETDETFVLALTDPSIGTTIGTATATGTILNDDIVPGVLSIAPLSSTKSEGNTGSTAFTFTVNRTGDTSGTASASWTVAGGLVQGADATDFVGGKLPSGTVSFAAGETSKTITVNVAGDTTAETDEAFTIALSSPTGATLGTAKADGLIGNDDDRAVVGTLDLLTPTSATNATFIGKGGVSTDGLGTTSTGTLSAEMPLGSSIVAAYLHVATRTFTGPFRPAQIGFEGTNVTPTYLSNVQDTGSGINFEVGVVDVTSIVRGKVGATSSTPIIDFNLDERPTGDSSLVEGTALTVIWSNPSAPQRTVLVLQGGLTGPATQTTLVNFGSGFDPTAPGFDARLALGIEYSFITSPPVQFSNVDINGIRLSSSTGGPDDANVTQVNGVLLTYGGVGDNPANPTSATSHDNNIDDELYTLNPFFTAGTQALAITTDNPSNDDLIFLMAFSVTGTGGITSGGSVLSVSSLDTRPEGNSGNTPFTFTVSRSGDTSGVASATWAVKGDGSNPANAADFSGGVLPSGTVAFAAGETSKTITINVAGDTTVEADEGLTVTLSAPSGASLGTALASATITNDDTQMSIAPLSGSNKEGNSGSTPFTFTVSRTGDISGTASAAWTVTGSGANPANAADFADGVLPTGTVTFAAGETSKTIAVRVAADTSGEPDETFTLTLANPSIGTTIGTATATGTILNDDTGISIRATTPALVEGQTIGRSFTFTVARTGGTASALSVDWAVSGTGASPANAADFDLGVLPSGKLTFAAGQSTRTITVKVAPDTIVEPDETFAVTLSNASGGAVITTATAIGTILNDDTVLSIAATGPSVAEGHTGVTQLPFTITRDGVLTGAASVKWSVTGSGKAAANAADFTDGKLPSGTAVFATGAKTATVMVNVAGDFAVEANESFTVTISNPSGAGTTIGNASVTRTILNDDAIGKTYVLTPAPTTIVGGIGHDLVIAPGSTLISRDRIDGGGGYNKLQLSGPGSFDLGAPAQLTNIQLVLATEGQAAGGGFADQTQTIYLRDGLNVTVAVAAGPVIKDNPNPPSITIYGADDASTINLGGGRASVFLGSEAETVNGGAGASLVVATAATAGALVRGGSGKLTLEIAEGGTATLDDDTTKVFVKLNAATNLTLSKMGFVTATGSAGADTLKAMAIGQTLTGRLGADTLIGHTGFGTTFRDTSAGLNGDTIQLFGGSDVVELSDMEFGAVRPLLYEGTATSGVLTATDGVHTARTTFIGNFTTANFKLGSDGNGAASISFQPS